MSKKNQKHKHKPINIIHNRRGPNEAFCEICKKHITQGKSKGGVKTWFIDKRRK